MPVDMEGAFEGGNETLDKVRSWGVENVNVLLVLSALCIILLIFVAYIYVPTWSMFATPDPPVAATAEGLTDSLTSGGAPGMFDHGSYSKTDNTLGAGNSSFFAANMGGGNGIGYEASKCGNLQPEEVDPYAWMMKDGTKEGMLDASLMMAAQGGHVNKGLEGFKDMSKKIPQ